jgi:hypothetical protein
LSFAGSPLAGSLDAAQQRLGLHANTSLGTFDGVIDQLPSHVGFSLAPDANGSQVLQVSTSGPITALTLDATGLPLPLGASNLHAEIDGIPASLELTIPSSPGGVVVFDPHGSTVGRVLAQVYGFFGPGSTVLDANGNPTPLPPGHQAIIYNEPLQQITVDLHAVGFTSAALTLSPLQVQYDISTDPLDMYVALGTVLQYTYFAANVSNPQPARLTVTRTSGGFLGSGVMVDYNTTAHPRRVNSIHQIDVFTNAIGFLEGHLTNIPANLHVCAGTVTVCEPSFRHKGELLRIGDRYPVIAYAPFFTVQILPTDGFGLPPAPQNAVGLSGVICPNTGPHFCQTNFNNPQRIELKNLSFTSLQAAAGPGHDFTLGGSDAVGWVGLDTNNDHLTGEVDYTAQGDSSHTLELKALGGGYVAASQFFVLGDVVSIVPPEFVTFSSGTFSCSGAKIDYKLPLLGLTTIASC